MKIISIFNQKGGVGKTTTAANVAHILATEYGYNVTLIDNDPQRNATKAVNHDPTDTFDTYSLYTDGWTDAANKTDHQNLTIYGSHKELSGLEQTLLDEKDFMSILKNKLTKTKGTDYYIIDNPPNVGLLTINALVASDLVIVPYDCTYFATEGLADILETVDSVKANLNPSLELKILITKFKQSKKSAQAEALLREALGDKVLTTKIRRSDTLESSQQLNLPIAAYTKRYTGYADYKALAEEIILNDYE